MGLIKELIQRDETTLSRLLYIWESSVRQTHIFLSENDINAIKLVVRSYLLEVHRLFCYCDESNSIQAFMGISGQQIEMLFVDGKNIGQGIGKRLASYAIDDLNIKYVDVNEQNERGVGFYIHMGFCVIGRSELDEQGRHFPILHLEMKTL